MSRINTNVTSLLSQRILKQNNSSLNQSLERLSTGLAINRGADDPAGLIASENLRSEKASIEAAIGNAERADQVMNIAEGGLQEVSSLLLEVQSLVGESANDAGLSNEEKEANQLQVDSILQTIDRIASSTSFQGAKLLNGSFDFTVSGQDPTVNDYQVNAAKLSHGDTRDIEIVVTASAQHASLFVSAGATLTNATGTFTFEIAGSKGNREFSFASGTTVASVAETINTFKEVTGVSAAAVSGGLLVKSTEFGSDEFVSFDIINAGGQLGNVYAMSAGDEDNANLVATATTFANVTSPIRDDGQDVGAIINGVTATSNGRSARIATDFLDMEIELTEAGSINLATIDAMTITGGGAKFNLGPNVDINNQVSIGLGNVASRKLGDVNEGYLSQLGSGNTANLVNGNLETAQKIVNSAISQVSSLRGKIGAFQSNVVGTTMRSLGIALENTSAAESSIRDTDFASETASLTRAQILSQASTNILSMANSQPQSALALLG